MIAARSLCKASSKLGVRRISNTAVKLGGGGGHPTPMLPPFARNKPPTDRLPEEVELVWDDTVAPEATLDFDAPHVSTSEVLATVAGAIAFFFTLYTMVSISDPEGSNPVATRGAVIPNSTMQQIIGAEVTEEEEEE